MVFNEDRKPAGCVVCAVAMINKNPNNSNGYALVWVQYRIIKTEQEMRFDRKKQAVSKKVMWEWGSEPDEITQRCNVQNRGRVQMTRVHR